MSEFGFPHRFTCCRLISRKPHFHWFQFDQSSFTQNGGQIRIRHTRLPTIRRSSSEDLSLREYEENEEVGGSLQYLL